MSAQSDWTYGEVGTRFPVKHGELWRAGPHLIACADVTRDARRAMRHWEGAPKACYTDPPWNDGNVRGFYTKAQRPKGPGYSNVLAAILDILREHRLPTWMEGSLYNRTQTERGLAAGGARTVACYEVTYYERNPSLIYQLSFGDDWPSIDLSGLDDEHTPAIVLNFLVRQRKLDAGDIVLDPCIGMGGTARAAIAMNLTVYGFELSPWRMSATLASIADGGFAPELVTVI